MKLFARNRSTAKLPTAITLFTRAILFTALLLAGPAVKLARAQSCITSGGSWTNSSLTRTGTGTFRVTFDATPSSSTMDAISGLSSGSAQAYTSVAAYVRFNTSGAIDIRNGANFSAANTVKYSAGATYHFILDVNVSAHTYSAYVVRNSVQTTLGTNVAFRSEQSSVSSLNNAVVRSAQGTLNMCNISMTSAPAITTQPASQTVTPGQSATFTVASTGSAPLTYQWKKNGSAISGATSSTYSTPATTTSDSGSQFTVTISNSSGSVTSSAATLTVSSSSSSLAASPSNLNFGSVQLSSTANQTITLTNSGRSSVSISRVSVSGAGFNVSGSAAGLTLSPGQTTTLAASFSPPGTGSYSGSISVTNNGSSSPLAIALSATGVTAAAHSVSLSWNSSGTATGGYDVYVGTVSGGPYSRLTAAPVNTTSYSDSTVQPGNTYYYVVTSINSSNVESSYSTEVQAVVP